MRVTPLGNFILIFCVSTAFASILFLNLSWAIVTLATAGLFIFARSKFAGEIESTNLDVERTILDQMVFAQEPVAVKVNVVNKDVNPVYGAIEDVLPEGAELVSGSNRMAAILKPRTLVTFSYTVKLRRRGEHKIGSMKIERSDPLGLFAEEQLVGKTTSINAHTKKDSFDAARRIGLREHFEFAGVSRMPAIVLRMQEFDSIRDYVPGDKARDILWKAYPKYGKLLTKTYIKEGSLQTFILMDCGRSMRISGRGASKIDHAVDLSMQLSNVLIGNYHPTGIAIFDEVAMIDKSDPALGKHQFENIVKILRKAPESIRPAPGREEVPETPARVSSPPSLTRAISPENNGDFLAAVASIKRQKSKTISVDGIIKTAVAKRKGQERLFIVISDLVSCRDGVIAGARICQRTGNRMLVIHTYDGWYQRDTPPGSVEEAEGMYQQMVDSRRVEAALRSLDASYIRIGPADTAPRIVRSVRRGMAK
ncbi:MAG: hypothetical protein A3K76_05675 [Euryarchaeota archaeon RBG_13_57_23]|nr:MAG: hypothetical protein A3K76_05675 [Euryarchaeota archaeon RBG_13_57_23]